MGQFLYQALDNTRSYFLAPETPSEVWLREEFHRWKAGVRQKLDAKTLSKIRGDLSKRNLDPNGAPEQLKQRLQAAISAHKLASIREQIAKEKSLPDYTRKLANARQTAEAKADIFHEIFAIQRKSSQKYQEATHDLRALDASLSGMRKRKEQLEQSARSNFAKAQETTKTIIKPGDKFSQKAERLFTAAATDAANAEALGSEIRKCLRSRETTAQHLAMCKEKKAMDSARNVAEQILAYRTKGDIPTMMKRIGIEQFWGSKDVQLAACQAIWFLAAPSPSRATAVQAARDELVAHGAIACVVRAIRIHCGDLTVLDPWALASLAFLTESPSQSTGRSGDEQSLERKYVAVQAMAVNEGSLEALVALLESDQHRDNERIVELACWGLKSVVGKAAANIRVAFDRGLVKCLKTTLKRFPETKKHRRNPNHWRYVYAQSLLSTIETSAYAVSAKKAAALQRQKPKSLRPLKRKAK